MSIKHTKEERQLLDSIHKKRSEQWSAIEEKMRLQLFKEMSQRVPAYKDFLKRNRINPSMVQTVEDLAHVPHISKDNYVRLYDLKSLSWDGNLDTQLVLTSTSGSTGKPVFFTRNDELDWQSSLIHELYFNTKGFKKDEPTLIIVAFGMGVWIGGLITYQAFHKMQERGYPISIITPGINKAEILKILNEVAKNYKQILIAGYPPFLKDIIDEAIKHKINLSKQKIRLLFAAEAFTEKFRSHMVKKAKLNSGLLDTMNIYGSADIGSMAFETPLSILIRQETTRSKKLFNDIFPPITKTPTLAQYIPSSISFEAEHGKLLVTGKNSIPLCRYMIGDNGGRFTYTEVSDIFENHAVPLQKVIKKARLNEYAYQLPFVYVYERMDFSTTVYGLQVYPEPIREILLNHPYDNFLTGKFTMITKFDKKQNQVLEIHFELQKSAHMHVRLEKKLLLDIIKKLQDTNSEFKELHQYLGDRAKPKLIFWPAEDPLYFKPGVKQKWVEK